MKVAASAFAILMLLGTSAAGRLSSPQRSGILLREETKVEGLPVLIATNQLGLGAEARALVPWIRAHPGPLTLRSSELLLEDAKAGSIRVSATMARTLSRLNQWHGLAATKDHPITHAQLRAGVLAPASIDRVRGLFEAAIRRGIRIGGQWLTPETGGEATLDRELRLVEARDPRWSVVQEMVSMSNDPEALAAFCDSRAAQVAEVDAHGLLRNAIARFKLGAAGSREEIARALLTVARNAAPTYSMAAEEQLALIVSSEWEGRYVGGWHTHAPHDANGGWVGGDVPSFEDMRNAAQYGQYLTLSFQPDGFDLYDAEALGDAKRIDLSLLKVIRYRSRSWRDHFRSLRPQAK